ncbi:multidrug transporter [Pigmentiphaga soli]|uniref:Multidrug transporter n=1 Tax=Pigmentiphaga soli TaxID=1007095 RepID=A0ABP8GXU9_9BURK
MKDELDRHVALPGQQHQPGQGELPVSKKRGGALNARPLWQAVPRLASYGLVLFGIWVVLAMMFPPMFVRSSERAVVNSPVTLITTPVEGTVTGQSVPVGASFAAGQPLMTLQNPNMDRALLMELTGKQLDTRQRYEAARAKLDNDEARLAQVNGELKRYQVAAQREHDAKIRNIQARLDAVRMQVWQQEDVVNRNQAMQWAGAVSEAYTSAARAQLAALSGSREALRAELESARSNSQAARGNVYLSSTDGPVGALAQRRDELLSDIAQDKAELEQLSQYGDSVEKLVASEQSRLDRVSNYEIKAYAAGVVQDVLAPPGTRVAAGATLMRATNCSQPRVVAVFPRSLSRKLLPGAKVTVRVDGVPLPMTGTVTEILPRAPDGDQARYFVPFPPIEKNEIYLIAKLDRPMPKIERTSGQLDNCALGHWAKVSLDNAWWNFGDMI